MKKNNQKGFTIVEILVVIAIIAVLLALVVPAVNRALVKSRQINDVSNAKQIGVLLTADAVEHNGVYRTQMDVNGQMQPIASSTELFNELIKDKELTDPKVVGGQGAQPLAPADTTLLGQHVAFGYVKGMKISDNGRMPLLFSRQTGITFVADKVTYNPTGNAWSGTGVVVFNVGNSAEFIKTPSSGSIETPLIGAVINPADYTILQP